jgi:predicted nucleic acid-binding protein
MYAAGVDHPHKAPSSAFIRDVAEETIEAVVDAEILQEILHRYRALKRWSDGRALYDLTRRIFPSVVPITSDVVDRARSLLDVYDGLMARDALHAAVVEIHAMEAICSYDRDFDIIKSIRRIEPPSS